ncbi:MAG: ABC transporter substrate-binding protein, partial [Ignavibacteriae bacterium]|nr:ABC transporter substrate-binding protein [Ignavibacteriota bacterium]
MKKLKLFLPILTLLLLMGCGENQDSQINKGTISDDLHQQFNFNEPPKRIISLAPNLTELLFELDAGNKIIGNTKYCNFPDSAKNIEKVGDLLTIDVEKIVSLNPDLIFITVEGNSKSDYEKLKDLGLKVFVSNPRSYRGIKKTLTDMSKILGKESFADSLIKGWDVRIEKVKKTHDIIFSQTVLFLVSTNPIFTVGKNSFVNEILTFAGLINISADENNNYPMFSREEIVKRDPDYILLYQNNTNRIDDL